MAVSSFGAAAGGSNDLGGEVVASATINGRGKFSVALEANKVYVASVIGTSSSGVDIKYGVGSSDYPLTGISSLTAGEGSVHFSVPTAADKLFVSGLNGSITIRKWAILADSFDFTSSVQSIGFDGFSTSHSPHAYVAQNDKHFFALNQSQQPVWAASKTNPTWKQLLFSSDGTPSSNYHNSYVMAASNSAVIISNYQYSASGLYRFSWNEAKQGYVYTNNSGSIFASSGMISITYIPSIGRFVAISNADSVAKYSDNDGVTWTSGGSVGSNNYLGLYLVNGILFAISGNSTTTYATSSDNGLTWTNRSWPVGATWSAPAFANGVYVANYSSNTGTTIYTSTDGFSWTSRTYPQFANGSLNPVAASGKIVILNKASISGQIRAAQTVDGITWTTSPYSYSENYHYTDVYTAFQCAFEYGGNVYALPTETNQAVVRWNSSDNKVVYAGAPKVVRDNYGGRNTCISPDGQKIWFPATSSYWHFFSIDGGFTWRTSTAYMYNVSASAWIGDAAVLFNNQVSTAYKFIPGANWSLSIQSFNANPYIEHVAVNGNYIFASSSSPSGYALRSSDGGATWLSNAFAGYRYVSPISGTSDFLISDTSNYFKRVTIAGTEAYPPGITTNFTNTPNGWQVSGLYNYYWTSANNGSAYITLNIFQSGAYIGTKTVSTSALAGIGSSVYSSFVAMKGVLFAYFYNANTGTKTSELRISYDNGTTWTNYSFPGIFSNIPSPQYISSNYPNSSYYLNTQDVGFLPIRILDPSNSAADSYVKWKLALV